MKIKSLCLLLLTLVFAGSCVHRDFEYENYKSGYIEVIFDWSNEPDANPQVMSLYLFPWNGGKPLRFDFGGREGGKIRVAPGVYDAICINSDQREVLYRDSESHSTFDITTSDATSMSFGSTLSVRSLDLPRAPGTENQRIAQQPPLLWSASEIEFTVSICTATKNNTDINYQVLRMYPRRIVDKYHVMVKNINNVQYLRSLNATISDMSDGYLAGQQTHNDISATIPIALQHNESMAKAEGEFLTFGHCPNSRKNHKLMLFAILSDNSKHYYEFDVSNQAHKPPDDNNVHHIVIDLLDLPKPTGDENPSEGFGATIDDWQPEDIGIKM